MRSKTGYANRSMPRFYIKLDGKIIWDFPKDFDVENMQHSWTDRNGISALVREYIDTPVDLLLNKEYSVRYADDNVVVSLTDLFKAADRRINNNKLLVWSNDVTNPVVLNVLGNRFSRWKALTKYPL